MPTFLDWFWRNNYLIGLLAMEASLCAAFPRKEKALIKWVVCTLVKIAAKRLNWPLIAPTGPYTPCFRSGPGMAPGVTPVIPPGVSLCIFWPPRLPQLILGDRNITTIYL